MSLSRPGRSPVRRAPSRPALLFLLLALATGLPALAAATFVWDGIQPGPHAVGLKVLATYDRQRTVARPTDYEGRPVQGEIGRPLLVLVWYPARPAAGAAPMTYGQLVDLSAQEMAFGSPTAGELAETREAFLADALSRGAPREKLEALFTRSTTAYRDAPAEEGTFPLVLYAPSWNGPASENSVLCETLASHGYVVAASASVGATAREMTLDPAGLQAQARDLEFLLALLRDDAQVSGGGAGVVGFSWGGLSELAAAMENARVAALVSFDGSLLHAEGVRALQALPGYDPDAVQVPLLVLRSGAPGEPPDLGLLDRLLYAPLLDVVLKPFAHRDFCSRFQLAYSLCPALQAGRDPSLVARGYEALCAVTLRFLDASLKGDAGARAFLDALPEGTALEAARLSVSRRPALKPPPTEGQFLAILLRDGVQRAAKIYDETRAANPSHQIFREATLNTVGYRFLARGWTKEAAGIFELNARAYPSSPNAWDSLAEARSAAGDKAGAAEAAGKVLPLLQKDATLSEAGKAQLRKRAQAVLDEGRR